MRSTVTRLRRVYVFSAALVLVSLLGGCATPPSVAPLLRVTQRALLDESGRLKVDAERDTLYTRQTLRTLEDAYNQDLDQAEGLTPDWVREATSVYVTARETTISHQHALAQEYRVRADNLVAAASATQRALVLIEQQDKLLDGAVNRDLRRLLTSSDWTPLEPTR